MKLVDPDTMTVSDIAANVRNWDKLRKLIGCSVIEPVKVANGMTIYCDENARLYSKTPACFFLPSFRDRKGEPLAVYGKAIITRSTEVVFPKQRAVSSLDKDFRTLGLHVKTTAGRNSTRLNFQAILTDERYVAATRVVLATFEDHVLNALPSADFLPMLELEIARDHRGAAFDLYDEVLAELGVPLDDSFINEGEDDDDEDYASMPGHLSVPNLSGNEAVLPDGQHRRVAIPRR